MDVKPSNTLKSLHFIYSLLQNQQKNVGTLLGSHNTLTKTISKLCSGAGISGFKTNHSLRTTAATRRELVTEASLVFEATIELLLKKEALSDIVNRVH